MLEIAVPGWKTLRLQHLVLDYNGTLACDGLLLEGVGEALNKLAGKLEVHVMTADTFGKAAENLEGVNCSLSILEPGKQDEAKEMFVKNLGAERSVSIGNGRNDRRMLLISALGIAVMLREGAASETLGAADAVYTDILAALEALNRPGRLKATLRS